MKYSRLAIAQTTGQVEAATVDAGTGNKTCPLFYATLKLFQAFDNSSPAQGKLIEVPAQTIPVFNASEAPLETNTEIVVGQMTDETWVYLPQGDTSVSPSQPWVRYRIQRGLSSAETGEWVAKALLVQGGSAINPLDPGNPVVPGSEFIIADPNNLFPHPTLHESLPQAALDANMTGSIGTAYLRTPVNSGNVPADLQRWEIETQSLPTKRMRVWIEDCLIVEQDSNGWNPDANPVETFFKDGRGFHHGAYVGSDFPNDVQDGFDDWKYKLIAYNPFQLTAVKQSYVWIELSCDAVWSVDNTTTPHSFGSDSPKWNIVDVEKPIARWGKFVKGEGSSGWDVTTPPTFKEGFDGITGIALGERCRPFIDPGDETCAPEGTEAWGFYNPEDHRYQLISTESAMYGSPPTAEVVTSASSGECGKITFSNSKIKVFCPPIPQDDVDVDLNFTEVEVVTSAYTQSGFLCLTKRSIKVCDAGAGSDLCVDLCDALLLKNVDVLTGFEFDRYGNLCFLSTQVAVCYVSPFVGRKCVNICDLICSCPQFYSLPEICDPPPPPCPDECIYVWDDNLDPPDWVLDTDCPDPNDPDCQCPELADDAEDGEFDGELLYVPCGTPPPSDCDGTCTECAEGAGRAYELVLDSLTHTANGPGWGGGKGDFISRTGCTLRYDYAWTSFLGGPAVPDKVTVEKDGSQWTVTFDDPPQGITKSYTYDRSGTVNPNDCNINVNSKSPDAPAGLPAGEDASMQVTGNCWNDVAASNVIEADSVRRKETSKGGRFLPLNPSAPSKYPRKPPSNQASAAGLGEAFMSRHPEYFKGCSCKKDVVPLMNRWTSKEEEGRIMKVVKRIKFGNKMRDVPNNTIRWHIIETMREFFNDED